MLTRIDSKQRLKQQSQFHKNKTMNFNEYLTWKYELHADNTTLWACKCLPSAASVTSTSDSLLRRLENTEIKFGW